MRLMKTFRLALGIVLGAAAVWVILSVPGFVSDRDSTVPVGAVGGAE